MSKQYLDINVYDAGNERIDFIFKNFERIYLSFSGGKDSGVMLNMVVDYMRKNNITEKIGIMVMDNEANYTHTTNFMKEIIDDNLDLLDIYWCCLPIALPCTTSAFIQEWYAWDEDKKEKWVNELPDRDYITTIENHKFPFFKKNMAYHVFWDEFGEWYSQGKKTACLIGIRTDESLNRFRAIVNTKKTMVDGKIWTKKNGENVYNVYPIYDMVTNDIWISNFKFNWKYNKLYDIFWMAGVSVPSMRVASPFMSEAKTSLNMYRIIDHSIWTKLCLRVSGANFIATYGRQLKYSDFKLPPNHSWKSFVKFLLETLPEEASRNYKDRFIQSFKYWGRKGRGLDEKTIEGLRCLGIKFKLNGYTAHGAKTKQRVIIKNFPDHLDDLKCHNSDVASWKRFAITILKNDHVCKYMGLAPTKEQEARKKQIVAKYSKL